MSRFPIAIVDAMGARTGETLELDLRKAPERRTLLDLDDGTRARVVDVRAIASDTVVFATRE